VKEIEENSELIESLIFLMTSGKVASEDVLAALEKFTEEPAGVSRILALLEQQENPAFKKIKESLCLSRLEDAARFYQQNKSTSVNQQYFRKNLDGFPLVMPSAWTALENNVELENFSCVLRDQFYLETRKGELPQISQHVDGLYQQGLSKVISDSTVWAGISPLQLLEYAWDQVDDKFREKLRTFKVELKALLKKQEDRALELLRELPETLSVESHQASLAALTSLDVTDDSVDRYIDLLFQWPYGDIAEHLRKEWGNSSENSRFEVLLTMRFGLLENSGLTNWSQYLEKEQAKIPQYRRSLKILSQKSPVSLLYLWCESHADVGQEMTSLLKQACLENSMSVKPEVLAQKWSEELSTVERNTLLGVEEELVETIEETVDDEPAEVLIVEDLEQNIPAISEEPIHVAENAEPSPSIWDEHMKPFLSANWFMMAGVILFIAGSSILSYFTWDKHWLFRYTLMPTLLASFTIGLAYLGRWIEEKDKQFVTTATILRGAAIQLLPINFMAVALVSSDGGVSMKNLIVPLMGGVYLALSWLGLKRWCGAVSAKLSQTLALTLLLLNSLVILAPLASALGFKNDSSLLLILGLGFYLGFAVLVQSVVHFSRHVLTAGMASERRVVWFFGVAIVGTFLQVFAWVHSHIQHLPQVHTYAPMLILAAGLLLMLERRAIQLTAKNTPLERESFLGYAKIFIGLLMGSGHEKVRIVCFLLAGVIWLLQAIQRGQEIHYYISISLFLSGVFSFGFLENFPREHLSILAVVNIAILSLSVKLSRRWKYYAFAKACSGSQVGVLLIAVIMAITSQLEYESLPIITAAYLLFAGLMFLRRAYLDDELKWVHTAMVIFALTLPYLGCVNLTAGTLEGNTLIFGLSILSLVWVLITKFIPFSLLKEVRSTVLWFYGFLAVTAMVIRVVMERHAAVDPLWYKGFMDYSGPLLMAIILVMASYYSRSLIPAFMASIIAIILFPELKANFRATFDLVGFGSGLGSAGSAMLIISLCFYLRGHVKLQQLGEGDRFMMKAFFPLRRYDHTLFTWPLMISACFLLIKTGSFNLIRQLSHHGNVSLKGAIALILVGLSSWLLCLYFRRQKGSLCFHLGWFYLGLGIHLTYEQLGDHPHWAWPSLTSLAILQVLFFSSRYYQSSYPWLESVFTMPVRRTLARLSHVFGVLCLVSTVILERENGLMLMTLFVGTQFIWHALHYRYNHFGIHLYLLILVNLLKWPLVDIQTLITPSALLALVSLLLYIFTGYKTKLYHKFKPLLWPFMLMSTLSALCLGMLAFPFIADEFGLSQVQIVLIALLFILMTHTHSSHFMFLWASVLLYGAWSYESGTTLFKPLHLTVWSLFLATSNHLISLVSKDSSRYLYGQKGLAFFKATAPAWLFVPALFLAVAAEVLHVTFWRQASDQIIASYLAALSLAVIARSWRQVWLNIVSVLFVTLGNVHFIRISSGDYLLEKGLSENHLICLGIGVTLMMLSALRRMLESSEIKAKVSHAGLALSMAILVILVGNYMTHPNLSTISLFRFFISGAMSLMAALHFRHAARYPQAGDDKFRELFDGVYHFGLSMSFWCVALMIPSLRSPQTAMVAFGLPALYLYMMAELGFQRKVRESSSYRNSASVLLLILLALYACRGFAHMIFYSEVPLEDSYYHANAPLLFLFGLLLFRMHALGGRLHLAFYGGLAGIVGAFFTVTSLPSLSPFKQPLNASWVAILSAHFWLLINHQKSPIRSFIMQISSLNKEQWTELRRPWGRCLLMATQISCFLALVSSHQQPLLLAPLGFGAASVAAHLFFMRSSKIYLAITLVEFLLALHAGFFVESYLAAENVIWVILGIWAAVSALQLCFSEKLSQVKSSSLAGAFGLLVGGHILYHGPESLTALLAVVCMAGLGLLTPYKQSLQGKDNEQCIALLYILLPCYLSYFGTLDNSSDLHSYLQLNSLPAAAFSLFCSGLFVHGLRYYPEKRCMKVFGLEDKVLNAILVWVRAESRLIYSAILWVSSLCVVFTLIGFYGSAFSKAQLLLMLFLTGGLVGSWHQHGLEHKRLKSSVMMICSGLCFLAIIRHQLVMTTNLWRNEYDIWVSLFISLSLSGLKPWIDRCEKELQKPLLSLLFLLPFAALAWSYYHQLGTNYTLSIIGCNSLIFSFLGKDDKASPYSLVSVGGYVAFTMIALWTKLDLHSLHIYILPAGVGILILVQLLKDKMTHESRRGVRLVTLLTMVGTTAYYALITEPHSVGFNVTMILLCVVVMGTGSFFRIRLYLSIGFAGLLVNILAILVRLVTDMNKGTRMAILGSLILVIGSTLVFANLYYKTHQEKIKVFVQKWRDKFGLWE
jgi:hypothetical protein